MAGLTRWAVAAPLAVLLCLSIGARAHAESITVGPSPLINIQMQGGNLQIISWNRPNVEIETGGRVSWRHFDSASVQGHIPQSIALWAQSVQTPRGAMAMPAERFVLPALPTGAHDAVVIRGAGPTVIHVPQSTALLAVRIARNGVLRIEGYHGAAFAALVHQGGVALQDVHSSGVVQVGRGPIVAENSSFGRLRARNAVGNLFFSHVTATQIDASSVGGSILADDIHFTPGLARFQSQHGNVVLGVRGGAQIEAHGGNAGAITTRFNNAHEIARQGSDIRATLAGGGPVVTATSTRGRVILYNGSIAEHPRLAARIPVIARSLGQVRARLNAAPKRAPRGGVIRSMRRAQGRRRPPPANVRRRAAKQRRRGPP